MSGVSVTLIGQTMRALLARDGMQLSYEDEATLRPVPVPLDQVASDAGLLPAFVTAGEAVWREITGDGFELDVIRDPSALLGYRLRAIRAASFTTVMLATMEATAQVARDGTVVLNEFHGLWVMAVRNADRVAETRTTAARTIAVAKRKQR